MKKWLLLAAVFFAFSVSYGAPSGEEVIPKISERRDNYIDKASISHEENVNYRVDNNETVRILLDVRNNDIEKVELIYGNNRAEMSSFGNYKGKEIFFVEVPNENFSYYFALTDGHAKYFYGKTQGENDSEIIPFTYQRSYDFTNMPEWAKTGTGYLIYIDTFRNGNYGNDAIFSVFGALRSSSPLGTKR